MEVFYSFNQVPENYSGLCYIATEGCKCWCSNGELYRDHNPAAVWDNGREEWYQHGECHRLNGFAIIDVATKTTVYYIQNRMVHPTRYENHPLVLNYKLEQILNL